MALAGLGGDGAGGGVVDDVDVPDGADEAGLLGEGLQRDDELGVPHVGAPYLPRRARQSSAPRPHTARRQHGRTRETGSATLPCVSGEGDASCHANAVRFATRSRVQR